MTLAWTAPADVAAGTDHARADAYDLRYSTSPITTRRRLRRRHASPRDSRAGGPRDDGDTSPSTVSLNGCHLLLRGARHRRGGQRLGVVRTSCRPNLPALPFYTLEIRSAPDYVANDHTPSLFQIGTPATRLRAGAQRGLLLQGGLLRDARSTRPRPTAAGPRAATRRRSVVWVHADEPWTAFPTLTTDSDGAIIESGSNGLGIYGRFGDTRLTGERYLQVVLARKSADGTAVDPGKRGLPECADQGDRVRPRDRRRLGAQRRPQHAGLVQDRARAVTGLDRSATPVPRATRGGSTAEGDEPYNEGAPLGGSFRMAVPTTSGDVRRVHGQRQQPAVERTGRLGGHAFRVPRTPSARRTWLPRPPRRRSLLLRRTRYRNIRVTWSGAGDDRGVVGYYVYRWQDAPAGARYTPEKRRIATVLDGDEYLDTGVVLGETYHYEVRAFDDATNVSPAIGCVATSPRRAGADTHPQPGRRGHRRAFRPSDVDRAEQGDERGGGRVPAPALEHADPDRGGLRDRDAHPRRHPGLARHDRVVRGDRPAHGRELLLDPQPRRAGEPLRAVEHRRDHHQRPARRSRSRPGPRRPTSGRRCVWTAG